MSWKPISETELQKELQSASSRMSLEQASLWKKVKVVPEKWAQEPYGNEGNGFWIVGILNHNVIWYNDIEEGFNLSPFTTEGRMDEYWCNQDQLEWVLQHIIDQEGNN